jgi:hypothetical protein
VRHTIQNIDKYKASLNSISTSYFSLLKTFSRINVSGNYTNAIIPTSLIGNDVGMDWFTHDPDSSRHGNDQSAYYNRPLMSDHSVRVAFSTASFRTSYNTSN